MPSTRGRRKLILSAALGLCVWLVAVVAGTLWRYPEFWVTPHQRFSRARALAAEGNPRGALAAIRLALVREPATAGYLVFKGYRELELNDPASAEQSFRGALGAEPSNVEARLGFATALARRRNRAAALATLDSLSPEHLTSPQLWRRSQLYASLGATRAALDDLALLLHADPSAPRLLREAATLAAALDDRPAVVSLAGRLAVASNDPGERQWAADTRARALESSGRIAEAYEGYQTAGNPDLLETRAQLAQRLGRFVDAASLYGVLARHNPSEPRFARSRAFALHAAGNRQAAEAAFRDLIAGGAADAAIRQAYAWQLNTQHRYGDAWRVIEPLPRPARDLALLELQARTALWAGRSEEAVQLVSALLASRPLDAELWKRLAELWLTLRDDRQAEQALRTYLRLQSQNAVMRQRLAEILARLGSLDAAIAEYGTLAAAQPDNADLWRSLGLVQETAGHLDAAKDSYIRAIEHAAEPAPDLYLRLGRLDRWTSQPGAAVEWYERYLTATRDAPQHRQARAELALALLEDGKPAESLAQLIARGSQEPLDADELMTAARSATAGGQHAAAALFLERLSEHRPLSTQEVMWLAGQYRALAQPEAALRVLERSDSGEALDPAVLEAIADLRYDTGDYRGALRALQRIGRGPDVALKVARNAARAGELDLATRSYQSYVARHPRDIEARLEAARYHASAGRPQAALVLYRDVIAARGAADLRLELARTHLAAEQFGAAEEWARQALAAGEDPDAAQLALAQSLHIQGRSREAAGVLRHLLAAAPGHPEGLVWRGQVAVALDDHLEAYRAFSRAIDSGVDHGDRVMLWMGTAARKRGDYARALAGYARAATHGAGPPEVSAAMRDLRTMSAPRLSMLSWGHADSNDLRLVQSGGAATVYLPGLRGAVSLHVSTGTLSQRAFTAGLTSAMLTLNQVFPTPQVELGATLGVDRFERAPDLIAWRGMATYHVSDDTRFGLAAAREPLLPLHGPAPLRQFNRVLDVGATGPGFYSDGIRAFAELLARETHHVRVEAGAEWLQDGNRQLFSYLHYEIPLATGVRRWTVLRPNLFLESFTDKRPSYFSPSNHLTVGTMVHSIRQYPHWDLEIEVNPQLLRTEGAIGFAGHGLVNVGARVGRVSIAGGTFLFYDGLEDYLQWRVGGRVTIPLKR